MPLADRVACLTEEVEQDQKDFPFYYVGNQLSGPLDNAMQAYGSSGGVQRDQVVLLCDSTHSVLWGKGEQGFLITRDGQLVSSQGIRISLDQMGPVEYENNALVEAASGTVLAHFKTQDLGDEDFCSVFNEIVLLPHPEKQEAAEPSAPREEPPATRPVPESEEKRVCSRCGAPVKPGARFCGQCGNPLESQGVPEASPTEGQGQNPPGKDHREAILAFCREFQEKISTPYYFRCTPHIPEKKLRNAMAAYGTHGGIRPEEVLVLCDCTLFGSAKEGFLLTADRLVAPTGSFALEECGEIIPAKGMTDSKVVLMPQDVVIADMPPSDEQTLFVQFFNEIVKK